MSNSTIQNKKGLTVKDLVTTGIFSALFFVASLIGGMPFAPNPVLTFYMPLGQALLAGPIIMLLLARSPKRGVLIIVGVLTGLIYFVLGMHWGMTVGYILMGIIADVISGTRDFRSKSTNIIAYSLLCLGSTGTYIVFFLDTESWVNTMTNGGTPTEYIETMQASGPSWLLPVILIGTVVIGLFSGWLGSKLLKKQFEKAGVTA